jgi:hypothetical protein
MGPQANSSYMKFLLDLRGVNGLIEERMTKCLPRLRLVTSDSSATNSPAPASSPVPLCPGKCAVRGILDGQNPVTGVWIAAVNLLHGLPIAILLGAAACTGPVEPLVVKQFQLRDQKTAPGDDPMVRNEKQRRLHGAVSMEERRGKLGQYYTLVWHDPEGAGTGPVELVFQYQQGATASRVKRMAKTFDSGEASGEAEFAIIGDDYFKNGRVLAWKATVTRGGRVLATRQSYLWQ